MVTQKVRQFLCGLHGHDTLRHFERGRMSLQCATCGHETAGWDLRRDDCQAADRANEFESVAGRKAQGSTIRGDMAW